MTKHTFTTEQSETILNALAELLESDLNAYSHARRINDMGRQLISHSIEVDESGSFDINIPGKYADELLTQTANLSDFFFEVGDALSSKN